MVGRYRSKKGIRFLALAFPAKPDEIDFDSVLGKGENIYILAHRPGIGKTYSVLKYLKKKIQEDKDFRFFYFTDRHATIEEHTKNWDEDTYSHWEGFERVCDNARMKSLYSYHLSAKDICEICGKCKKYTPQFKDTSRVFAPFNYLRSNDFQDNLPSIFFLDENIKQFDSYSADYGKAVRVFSEMGREDLAELVRKKDCDALSKKLSPETFYDDYKAFILKLSKNKGKNKSILDLIKEFNIFDFYQYVRWESIYGYGLKSYTVPSNYYGAFEAVIKGVPAVFMDATFNLYWFSYLLECYNAESKFIGKQDFKNLRIRGFKQWEEDIGKKSVTYRMRPENVMPKVSFTKSENWKRTKEWLTVHMKIIMNIFGRNNVGIITFKELGDFPKALGYDIEYYGSLRGTNILEDNPVLVLIGSYSPIVASWHANAKSEIKEKEYFDELLSKYLFLEVNENNLISVGVEAPRGISGKHKYNLAKVYAYQYIGKIGKLYGTFGDEIVKRPAEALTTLFWYDEIYQAFHRNRGLLKEKIIFAYCWFPEPKATIFATDDKGNITGNRIGNLKLFDHDIRKECYIDKIDNDIVNEFFALLIEIEHLGKLDEAMTYLLQHPETTITEIATRFKVHKKGEKRGLDTQPITMLRKAFKILEEEAKRSERTGLLLIDALSNERS
jgi:hypothetical protein